MRYPTRATVCVSSQAGCAMACTFCATGQAGFERHLDRGGDRRAGRCARAHGVSAAREQRRVHGHGRAARQLRRRRGPPSSGCTTTSASRLAGITISTVGVVPGDAPARRARRSRSPSRCRCTRADDELRNRLVPLNRRYPIAEVLDAAADFAGATGRRITFEYACIAGVNDSPDAGRGARRPPPARSPAPAAPT